MSRARKAKRNRELANSVKMRLVETSINRFEAAEAKIRKVVDVAEKMADKMGDVVENLREFEPVDANNCAMPKLLEACADEFVYQPSKADLEGLGDVIHCAQVSFPNLGFLDSWSKHNTEFWTDTQTSSPRADKRYAKALSLSIANFKKEMLDLYRVYRKERKQAELEP